MQAAEGGSAEIVRLLVDKGAMVDAADKVNIHASTDFRLITI